MANRSSRSVGFVVVCLCIASAHADTIFECTGKDGRHVLQNMPCDADSDGRVSGTGDARGASVTTDSAPPSTGVADAGPNRATPTDSPGARRAPADAAAAANAAASLAGSDAAADLPSEPELGMTQQQVRAILGAPTAITQEEASQGIEMTWIYDDSRVMQFDASGRLSKK
jgi:hypothetical protein